MQMTTDDEVEKLNERRKKNVIPLKHTYMNEFTSIFDRAIYPHNIEQTETLKY